MEKGNWTFLSNHGRVLVYLAKNPSSTTETISREVDLSLRGVQKIISDLENGGYVARTKEGRCNRYTIHPDRPMRHRLESNHVIGEILLAMGYHD